MMQSLVYVIVNSEERNSVLKVYAEWAQGEVLAVVEVHVWFGVWLPLVSEFEW